MEKQNQDICLSVILPSYNGGGFLLLAVRSVLYQTFKNWELIVLDDGSSDSSIDPVVALGDERIRIISDGVNKGLAARLNEGVSFAKGKYIARMDADDICFPERFQKQVEYLDANPEVDLLGTLIVTFKDKDFCFVSAPLLSHAAICSKPWSGIRVPHPTWMGRAEWFRKFQYHIPEYVRAEDQELLLRAITSSQYAVLPDVLLAYRQWGFDCKKIQLARRSLLSAQLTQFRASAQWGFFALSFLSYLLKTGIDLISTLPGMDKIFFARMGKEVSPELLAKLEDMGVL